MNGLEEINLLIKGKKITGKLSSFADNLYVPKLFNITLEKNRFFEAIPDNLRKRWNTNYCVHIPLYYLQDLSTQNRFLEEELKKGKFFNFDPEVIGNNIRFSISGRFCFGDKIYIFPQYKKTSKKWGRASFSFLGKGTRPIFIFELKFRLKIKNLSQQPLPQRQEFYLFSINFFFSFKIPGYD